MTFHDILMESRAQQREQDTRDLSLLSEDELRAEYHNVYECGCAVCSEKLEAIAEEFFK